MKKLSVIFVIFWLMEGSKIVCAGSLPMSYLGYSVLVSSPAGSGSGFFLQASNSCYLVTARHVLFVNQRTNWTLRTPKAKFTYYSTGSETPCDLTLDLGALFQRGDVRYSTNHDIAMVRFEDCNPTNSAVVTIDTNVVAFSDSARAAVVMAQFNGTRRFGDVDVGTDIFLIGFPSSIGLSEQPQINSEAPLVRKGIVAGKNTTLRTLVVDSPSFPGNSGGPVIERTQTDLFNAGYYVVGVLIEFVPFSQTWENRQFGLINHEWSNSGYSIVEPMDTVLDMVWK